MFQLVKLEHQLCAQGSLVSSGTPQGTGGGGDQATKDEAYCPLCAVHLRAPNIQFGLQRPQKQSMAEAKFYSLHKGSFSNDCTQKWGMVCIFLR